MDERSITLLKELLTSPGITIKGLEQKVGLTRNQVNYSLKKVNSWLEMNGFNKIDNDRYNGLLVDDKVHALLPEKEKGNKFQQIPNEKERILLICILLLGRTEELSLIHLADALELSKNTVLKDIKKAEEIVAPFNIQISYNRKIGYYIEGTEFNKRKLLIHVTRKLLQSAEGEVWIRTISGISFQDIEMMIKRFEKIEKKLGVTFTDERLQELPYCLLLLLKRISMGKELGDNEVPFVDLSNTKAYKVVEDLLWGLAAVKEKDRLFIALQLVTTNVIAINEEDYDDAIVLGAINEMLTAFEQYACILFHERGILEKKLLQHLKPAFYRIRYGLTHENPLLEEIKKEHYEVHDLVKKSLYPIENLIQHPFTEEEAGYITLLIKSWLHKYGDEVSEKPRAVVVCPNGISVSKLLFESLKELFPHFLFLEHISVRDFVCYRHSVDIVFSTVPVQTDKKLFIIRTLLNEQEKRELQQRVAEGVNGIRTSTVQLESILQLIEKHTKVINYQALKSELKNLLFEKRLPVQIDEKEKPSIADIMQPDFIQFKKKQLSWQDAIHTAAMPLLENKIIEWKYIMAMIEKYDPDEPYIIIAPKVAIPHASPEDGVLEVGMSALILEEGVEFADGIFVQLVVIIAAVDRSSHLRALFQLNRLIEEEERISRLLSTRTTEEFYAYIKQAASFIEET